MLRPESICNAVDENGAGVTDPTAHLACYRAKDAAQQPRFTARAVSVTDEFGAEYERYKARTWRLVRGVW